MPALAIALLWFGAIGMICYEASVAKDEPAKGERPTTLASWILLWYETAHSDIQWSKERGWNALQAVLLLDGALVAARQTLLRSGDGSVLSWIAGLAGAVGMIYLTDLHRFARKARVVGDRLLETANGYEYFLGEKRKRDRHHVFYLGLKLVIVALASTLVILALSQGPTADVSRSVSRP